MRLPILAALLMPLTASAQTEIYWPPAAFPALYDVTSDALSIHEAPSSDSPVLGSVPGPRKEVTRLSDDENWGAVNSVHGYGWVDMSSLTRADAGEDLFDRPLYCQGTEPFWDMRFDGSGNAVFTNFSANEEIPLPLTVGVKDKVIADPMGVEIAEISGPDSRFLTTLVPRYCIDSMTDAEWGIEILALEDRADGSTYPWSGCCSLEMPEN